MADTRIITIFIFAVSFIITFPILVAYSAPYKHEAASFQNPNIPDEFSALDFTTLAWYDNDTIGPSNYADPTNPQPPFGNPVQFMLPPGVDAKIEVWGYWNENPPGSPTDTLYFNHVWMEWWWRIWENIEGLDGVGYGFSKSEVLATWDANTNVSSIVAKCSHGTQYYIYVTYNNSAYTNLEDAINHFDVMVMVGVGWDDTLAAPNAWSIVGSLMTFQLADIPAPMNYLVGIPFYACIGILAVIIILWFIPLLGD